MNKLWAVMIVVVLLVAGTFVFVFAGVAAQSGNISGNTTIYIEDTETGQVLAATVKMGQASFGEQMMLDFGQKIRQATFEPLAAYGSSVGPLYETSVYKVWASSNVTVTSSGIKSLTSSSMVYTGIVTGPQRNMAQKCLCSDNVADKSVSIANKLVLNGTSHTDMYVDGGKKFTNFYDSSTYVSGATQQITGTWVDGLKITVVATISVVDNSGHAIMKSDTATLTISATFYPDAVITVAVTGMGGSAG